MSFNLGEEDLQHFADVAEHTRAAAAARPHAEIVAAAREVLDQGGQARHAQFVKERYAGLGEMLDMVSDVAWNLTDPDLQRVINALACFGARDPESTAGGVLDHAIMIELVSRDLEHDLVAYRDFCKYREAQQKRRGEGAELDQALAQRRDALQARMHARRKKDLSDAGGAVRRLFSLFGL